MTSTANISLLNTARLELEPLNAAHAEELFPLLLDPGLYTYMEGGPPASVSWLRERYSHLSKRVSGDGRQHWLNWIPRQKTSKQCVGYFESTVENKTAWLAYYVFKDFQGQGYAKEGLREIMSFLAANHDVRKFVIEMDTRNLPSVRLAQAFGFEWVKTTNKVTSFKGFESHEFRFEYRIEPSVEKIDRRSLRAYTQFRNPDLDEKFVEERLADSEKSFSKFCSEQETVYVAKLNGSIQGAICALKFQPSVYGLANLKISNRLVYEALFNGLIETAVAGCKSFGARRIAYRVIEGSFADSEERVLKRLGFRYKHERVEFRKELSWLPSDEGSPLIWEEPLSLSDESFSRAASVMARAAQNDPDYDPTADAEAVIRAALQENHLSSGPHCIHFAKVDGEDAGIVIAQVDSRTGWSRITYMGLYPEFRGKGLGRWIHRHGFEMLRRQGGKLYHGGTLSQNVNMVKLFTMHGCDKFRTMQEWELRSNDETTWSDINL